MKTAEEYYEELRKQGETDAITSNPDPDYTLPFYQAIFGLMEGYFNQQKEDICKKQLDDLFTGELKCECKDEDKHGWTLFYLCHHCGREYKFKEVPLNQLKR